MATNGRKLQNYINKEYEKVLTNHESRLEVANKEMGEVKEHLAKVETDMDWVKDSVKKIDGRTWIILATIIIGILLQLIKK